MVESVKYATKEHKIVSVIFIGGAIIAYLGCGVITENRSLKIQLQSVKHENQKLLDEKMQLEKSYRVELQSFEDTNQKLLDEKKRSLKRIDQINDKHAVYSTQVKFIQVWMNAIEELEDHIYVVIHYSKLKDKGSKFYSYSEYERRRIYKLRSKIPYDFDESYANEIISRAIDLVMKLKKECRKFLNALLLKDLEEMKSLQINTDMFMIEEKMKEFVEEVSGFKY